MRDFFDQLEQAIWGFYRSPISVQIRDWEVLKILQSSPAKEIHWVWLDNGDELIVFCEQSSQNKSKWSFSIARIPRRREKS